MSHIHHGNVLEGTWRLVDKGENYPSNRGDFRPDGKIIEHVPDSRVLTVDDDIVLTPQQLRDVKLIVVTSDANLTLPDAVDLIPMLSEPRAGDMITVIVSVKAESTLVIAAGDGGQLALPTAADYFPSAASSTRQLFIRITSVDKGSEGYIVY
jgi:hypothetical protein